MILSVSRRTDIPAFYMDWFLARLAAGEVLIRNPMRPRQVARVDISRPKLDGIVFWTKNPLPLLEGRASLGDIPYYVQCTVTGYGAEIEPGIPDKWAQILPALQQLAETIGPHRIIWRYDPILLNHSYTIAHHLETFADFAARLSGCTHRCVISFVDAYRGMQRHAQALHLQTIDEETMRVMASKMAQIAGAHDMTIEACAEPYDLADCGVAKGKCVDAALLARIAGAPIKARKEKGQRLACGCDASVDLGAYDTCPGGCLYCYATHGGTRVPGNVAAHDPASPMLVGWPEAADEIYDRVVLP